MKNSKKRNWWRHRLIDLELCWDSWQRKNSDLERDRLHWGSLRKRDECLGRRNSLTLERMLQVKALCSWDRSPMSVKSLVFIGLSLSLCNILNLLNNLRCLHRSNLVKLSHLARYCCLINSYHVKKKELFNNRKVMTLKKTKMNSRK